VPRYVGVQGNVSATITGGVGFVVNVNDQGHYTRFSSGTKFGLDIAFGVTAFVGLGIRHLFGAELTGGGDMAFGFFAAADPNVPKVKIIGGWDLGIRAYIAFIRWKSTIFSKHWQLYPKVNSAESDLASESQLNEFSIVTPEAEGKAVRKYSNDSGGGYT